MKKFLRIACLVAILVPMFVSAASAGPALTVEAVSALSGSVPIGAQRVPMLQLTLTASCDADVRLQSVTLRHRGLGDPRDVERVYAYQNGVRRTRAAFVIGKDGSATLQFRGLPIAKCIGATFDVAADLSASAIVAGEHGFMLRSAADVVTDPPARVTLAASSSTMGTVRPVGQTVGAVSAELLPLTQTLSYGSSRTVARLRLHADAARDQEITAITFTNDGSAQNADLQNLRVESNAREALTDVRPSLEGSAVRLTFTPPLRLQSNETRLLQLVADVRASRRRTVRFLIEEPGDMEARPVR